MAYKPKGFPILKVSWKLIPKEVDRPYSPAVKRSPPAESSQVWTVMFNAMCPADSAASGSYALWQGNLCSGTEARVLITKIYTKILETCFFGAKGLGGIFWGAKPLGLGTLTT